MSIEIESPPGIESPPEIEPIPEIISRQDKIMTVALYFGQAAVIAFALKPLVDPVLDPLLKRFF